MTDDELMTFAHKIDTRGDLVKFLDTLGEAIVEGEIKTLKSYEVIDGCENLAASLDSWCAYRNIPFDEQPTWSLVAWIILAGALND